MVILDELCSGTNPSEGEEIFELVVNDAHARSGRRRSSRRTSSRSRPASSERAKIADLRFLQVELGADQEPTYQFVPGVARTSLAGHAAARLGVTGEQLIALIERNVARARFARGRARG